MGPHPVCIHCTHCNLRGYLGLARPGVSKIRQVLFPRGVVRASDVDVCSAASRAGLCESHGPTQCAKAVNSMQIARAAAQRSLGSRLGTKLAKRAEQRGRGQMKIVMAQNGDAQGSGVVLLTTSTPHSLVRQDLPTCTVSNDACTRVRRALAPVASRWLTCRDMSYVTAAPTQYTRTSAHALPTRALCVSRRPGHRRLGG